MNVDAEEADRLRCDLFLPRFFQGLSVGLAAYQSLPKISEGNVFVGDPLLRSALRRSLAPTIIRSERTMTPAGEGIQDLLVEGRHFTSRADMIITVAGRRVDQFDVLSSTRLRVQIPPLFSGLHDVQVKTFMGEAVERQSVIAWPAIQLIGATGRGLPVNLAIYGNPGDRYQVFMSERLSQQAVKSYGTLFLDPGAGFDNILSGTLDSNREEHMGVVPRVDDYAGKVLYLQALVGDRSEGEARLTNVLKVRLR